MTLKGTKFLISMVSDVYGQIVHIYGYRSHFLFRQRKKETDKPLLSVFMGSGKNVVVFSEFFSIFSGKWENIRLH